MSKNIRIKPGKGPSFAGMIVGVFFCLFGLLVAIPTMGIFGFIWTVVAAGITIMNAVNVFSEQGISTHEIVMEDETKNIRKTEEKETVEERLNKVERLYNEGIITMEEREEQRKKILNEI